MKKAAVKPLTHTITGLVLAAIVLIALVSFSSKLLGIFFNTEKDKFPDFVNELNKRPAGVVVLTLNKNEAVLGFDKGQDELGYRKGIIAEAGYVDLGFKVDRPNSCVDACICKCNNFENRVCEEAQCQSIIDVDRISDFYSDQTDQLTNPEDVEGFYIKGATQIVLYFNKKDRELIISDKQV